MEDPKRFERSLARGRREGTPFYLQAQVMIAVGVVAAIVIAIALLTWALTK